jgi:hypothetical protein
MKNAFIITLLTFGLVMGLSVPSVFAAEQTSNPKNGESAEKDWQQAFKTQVSLAKAKVAMLKAHSELLLNKNKEGALRSLEEAKTYLNEAYEGAEQDMQAQIAGLKREVEKAKNVVQEKGQQAASRLTGLVDMSEAALNTAVSETHARANILKKEASTRLALAHAKALALEAKIALELEQSPEKAKHALTKAEGYLAEAKSVASQRASQGIAGLQDQTRRAKKYVTGNAKEAGQKLDDLIINIDEQLQAYGIRIKESEEMGLLKKRYAQLEAQAALMRARFAAEKEATYEQVYAYLDEAKAWYARAKGETKEKVNRKIIDIEEYIDDAKVALKKKAKGVRKDIADLLNRAADIVNGKE